MLTRYGLPLVAVALLAFAVLHVMAGQKPETKSTPALQPPRTPFAATVAGSGMVEAENENIAIGSAISGVAISVKAKVGTQVKPGDELFRLDDRQQRAELKFREAAHAAALADLKRLENQPRPEQLEMNAAQVAEAEANVADQRDQFQRSRELHSRKVATDSEFLTREQMYRVAQAKLAHAKAEYAMQKSGAWEYDKLIAKAAVQQAAAQVEQVRTELERLVVRALVEGEVLQVDVRPGEFVAAPATRALVVVGNVKQLHVRVDIDEYDIHRYRTNAPAVAKLKGQPDVEFKLKFVHVEPFVVPKKSLTGENTERVDTRVLQVIYELDLDGRTLYVGQQLDVYVDVSERS